MVPAIRIPARAPALIAALAALTALGTGACGGSTARPNIVLISIDSLRADHVGSYGYEPATTPTIDALAAQGVRFASAASTTSWTLPAHAAMFTGMYDSAHALVTNGLALSEELTTLAETLQAAGYDTAGFFGGPYLHPTFGLAQGFETYQSCMTALPDDLSGDQARAQAMGHIQAAHRDITSPRTVEEVKKWCERRDDRPFFAFVHLWDVHYDYCPPKEYVDLFDPDYTGNFNASNYAGNRAIRQGMNPRDLQHLLALYDGEIRWTDDHLARLLELFERKAGGADKLFVVVTADHGDEFFEHGSKGHQQTLYEEVIRVPLVFRWPGHLAAGRVVDQQVRLIDLMPTLCAAAGAKPPPTVQGRNLLPLLEAGGPLPSEPSLSELHVAPFELRALRTESFKLISRDHDRLIESYALDQDPRETRFVPPQDPRIAQAREQLKKLVRNSVALRERVGADPTNIKADPKLLIALKQLGYLGQENDESESGSEPEKPKK